MFTQEQRDLKKRIQKFAAEKNLAALAPMVDESPRKNWDLVKMLADEGFLRFMVPKEYGGEGMVSCVNLCIIRETFSEVCTAAEGACIVQALGTYPISIYGTEAQKKKYLPRIATGEIMPCFAISELDAGSDIGNIKTTAVLDGDHYVLNGQKFWASNGPDAAIFIVFAKTDPTKGVKGISAFIVEKGTPGLDTSQTVDLMLTHAMSCPKLVNCRIPKENLLGTVGEGIKIGLVNLDMFRTTVGASAVGIAQHAYTEALSYAKERILFGQPLSDFQLTRAKLADMATEIQAARLMVYWAANLKDRGAEHGEIIKSASMAKLYATEVSRRVVDESLQIHGGRGLIKGSTIERLYRTERAMRIYEGTSEIQRLTIARQVLGSK